MQPLYTIGHSDRELADVLALLQGAGAARLADVRAFTRSRTNPGFNEATFPTLLAAGGVENRHFAALGGRRGSERGITRQVIALWRNRSFHNYADHAQLADFRAGLDVLTDWAQGRPAHHRRLADRGWTRGLAHHGQRPLGPGRADARCGDRGGRRRHLSGGRSDEIRSDEIMREFQPHRLDPRYRLA